MTKTTDFWFTPSNDRHPVLSVVTTALGGQIGLDPCANAAKTVPALVHYTEEDDCFLRTAQGLSAFQNPPFSNPYPFIKWLSDEVIAGRCPEAIGLYKAGVLNNQKTGRLIRERASAFCHWQHNGRIMFTPSEALIEQRKAEGKGIPTSADFDTVFVYFGDDPSLFLDVFNQYGLISLNKSYSQYA